MKTEKTSKADGKLSLAGELPTLLHHLLFIHLYVYLCGNVHVDLCARLSFALRCALPLIYVYFSVCVRVYVAGAAASQNA